MENKKLNNKKKRKKKKNPIRKWERNMRKHFTEEDIHIANKHMKN